MLSIQHSNWHISVMVIKSAFSKIKDFIILRLNHLHKYSMLLERQQNVNTSQRFAVCFYWLQAVLFKAQLAVSHEKPFNPVFLCMPIWRMVFCSVTHLVRKLSFSELGDACAIWPGLFCNSPPFISMCGNMGFCIQWHLCIQKLLLSYALSLLSLEA